MKTILRNQNGTFQRIRKQFSLNNFNDGYIDCNGYFRVLSPDHPRVFHDGYIRRATVAYELYHGIKIPPKMAIHHKDKNRLNDSKENLVMVAHNLHRTKFHKGYGVCIEKICQTCDQPFKLKRHTAGKFCSQKCYHQKKRSDTHSAHIGEGLRKAYAEGRRKVM